VGSSLLVAVLITDGCFPLGQIRTYLSIAKAEAAVADEEFVGPFPSWANVKVMYGAVGNGVADDTANLQNALNDLGQANKPVVLYLPAGTYKITNTLNLKYRINVSIIGENPATTKIKWAGASSGVMLWINGMAYSRFNRITFDGSNTALVAVDQSWDNSPGYFDTGNEYADDVFQDVGYGIRGGDLGYGFAETAVMRSKFIRNFKAGIILRNFNALDLFVWYSTFEDCNIGITNRPGAGNWRVYNSLFKNSTVTDLDIGNTGGFSARNNTSINSQKFLSAGLNSNPAEISLQGNTIIDPINTIAIAVGNQGPVLLLDNAFRSRSGATGAVFSHSSSPDSDTIAIGNTFTVGNPISAGGRLISIDNTTVSLTSLSGLGEPALPSTPPNLNRQVFEVPSGASAATIQQALNAAAAQSGSRPVVHLPTGTYAISTTLSIPANSDVQLVGDGYSTMLQWSGSGSGPALRINGPSKATLRDMAVNGNGREGIVANGLDQSGSRVFMHQAELRQSTQANILVDGLDYTNVDIRNFGSAYMNSGVGVKVVGGPLANAGTPADGKTNLFSGASSNNVQSYTVANGGTLLVRDVWYETGSMPGFIDLSNTSGTLTVENNRIALPSNQTTPAINISGFTGKAAFLENHLDDRIVISSGGSQAKVLGLGMLGNNLSGSIQTYFVNNGSPVADARLLNSRQQTSAGSIQVTNVGTAELTYIREMMTHTRSEQPEILTTLPSGVTDLRFFRVWVTSATVGIHLLPGTTSTPSFDFSLTNSGNISITQGMQGASTITASLSSGTGQSVSFSASGLPAGATAAFSGASCTPTCTSTMTIQTSTSTLVGSYPITVTGTGGGKSHTTSFTLTVNAPSTPFDFSLSNGQNKTVTQGQAVTNTVSATLVSGTSQAVSFSASGLPAGTTATFSPTACNLTCTSTMTVQTTASTPTGSYTITVTGTARTLSRTTSFTLTVSPVSHNKFQIGNRVFVNTDRLYVYATPSGTRLGYHRRGDQGTVISGPTVSGGLNWYKINYDSSPDGWSVQDYLEKR
jgi:hypothetical protein